MNLWNDYNLVMPNGTVFGEEVGTKMINCPYIPKADKKDGRPVLMSNSERRIAFSIDPNTKIILRKFDGSHLTSERFEAFIHALTTPKPETSPPPKKVPNPSPRRTKL